MLVAKTFLYFKLNSAFTCAVTVTACGVNSSVGAGVALAMADIARAMCGTTILGFFKRVNRRVREFSKSSATGASERFGGVVGPAICILDRLILCIVDIFEGIAERLSLADVRVGELLRDGAYFCEILELQRDVCRNPISNDMLLRPILIGGLHGEEANVRSLRIDSVGAQHLPHLLHIFRSALERRLRRFILHRDVELNLGGVWGGLKFSVSAHIDRVRLRIYR